MSLNDRIETFDDANTVFDIVTGLAQGEIFLPKEFKFLATIKKLIN